MNKLNKIGNNVLEYKIELSKSYPKIVVDSLLSSIDKLVEDEIIDVDIHFSLKEKEVSFEDLKELLLTKSDYVKTNEQLFEEYEQVRKKIDVLLEIDNISEKELADIKTISFVNNERIAITKEFLLTDNFIRNYFYIESDKDYEVLMKRKGFIEKFAILRLDKILRDFRDLAICSTEDYEIVNSNVFYEADRNIYGIHLLFNVSIEYLEDELIRNDLILEIKNIIDKSKNYFDNRMTI